MQAATRSSNLTISTQWRIIVINISLNFMTTKEYPTRLSLMIWWYDKHDRMLRMLHLTGFQIFVSSTCSENTSAWNLVSCVEGTVRLRVMFNFTSFENWSFRGGNYEVRFILRHNIHHLFLLDWYHVDRLCGLVIRVPGYRSKGPGSILDATRFSEK
jgi:hypothetical protein